LLRHFEDYRAGESHDLGRRVVGEDEIVEFASKYDPLPFHTDKAAAAASPYGGLTSSGWLTALVMMRMLNEGFLCVETSLGSPGIEKLEWLLPVRPGDELSGRVEVNAVRASRTRPEMGFVTNTATLSNQRGELVYRSRSVAIVRTRPKCVE
jgi:acyl dehydratase